MHVGLLYFPGVDKGMRRDKNTGERTNWRLIQVVKEFYIQPAVCPYLGQADFSIWSFYWEPALK